MTDTHKRHLEPVPDPSVYADAARRRILDELTRHIGVARQLGVEPLTIEERAAAMLDGACAGWRVSRQCRDEDGSYRTEPHPECLLAQYQHDVLLLEHGLLRTGGDGE